MPCTVFTSLLVDESPLALARLRVTRLLDFAYETASKVAPAVSKYVLVDLLKVGVESHSRRRVLHGALSTLNAEDPRHSGVDVTS